jgi:hypothetical protein
MIGLDFPIKPEWVHAVHDLWRPEQPVQELIQESLVKAIPELGGEKTRRNSLSIILRNFVTIDGGSRGHTATQDVWASYSQIYTISMMAPAYLAQIIANNEVAQFATRFITSRYEPSGIFHSSELRKQLSAKFGQRKVVTNSASAFISTLQYFGVLAAGEKQYTYRYLGQLPVDRKTFPLLVWISWKANPMPQIDLDEFSQYPAQSFFVTDQFDEYWQAYQPALWVLMERLERRAATLKAASEQAWQDKLLSEIA